MPERRPRRIATWTLTVVGVLVSATYLAFRLFGASDGAQVPFYTDAWSRDGVRIHVLPGPSGGLRDGDVVTAVSGVPIERWLDHPLGASGPGGVARPAGNGAVAIYAVRRGDAQLQVPVVLAQHDVGGLLEDFWSAVVLTLVLQAVAVWVLLRRPQVEAAVALAIVAVGVTGSTLPWLLGTQVSDVAMGWPFLLGHFATDGLYILLWPAGAFHLPLALLRDAPIRRRTLAFVYGVPILAYVAALAATRLTSPSTLEWMGRIAAAQGVVILPTVLAGGVLTVVLVRRASRTVRDRARWATLGGGVSLVLGVTLLFVPQLATGRPLVPWSAVGLVALPLPLGIAASILWSNLFDVEVVVNRALVYGGATLAIAASYVVAVSVLGNVLGADRGLSVSLVASGLVAVVALPIRDVLQDAVDRLMYGDRDDPYRAITRLGRRLEASVDPLDAPEVIVRTVAESMRLPWVALRVRAAENGRAGEGDRAAGDGRGTEDSRTADGPAADEPAAADGSRSGTAGRTVEHGRRPTVGETVSVPLVYGAEVVGDLIVAPRSATEPLSAADRALLDGLARQVAAAVRALALTLDLVASRERIVAAREEERRRIRRDLHDGLGPTLAAVGMRAEVAADLVSAEPAEAQRLLAGMRDDVRAAIADIRRLVDALRPPALDELGLVGAIEAQADHLGPDPSIVVVAEGPLPDLPAAVEVAAYRIAVEAMTNVARHAEARSCRVAIGVEGEQTPVLRLEVADDGKGIASTARPGIGLASMRERAAEVGGSCTVTAGPAGGTVVRAVLPLGGRDGARGGSPA